MRDEAVTTGTPAGDDWTVQVGDTIEHTVGVLRDKTAVPLLAVARTIVYGLLAAIVGSMALALLAIGGVRALDVYLPGRVWSADLVAGGIFTLPGAFLWAKRRRR